MSSTNGSKNGCERARELADRRADGEALRPEELEQFRMHAGSCTDCATDEAVASLIADLDAPAPAAELDAAARERWIEDALRGAAKSGPSRPATSNRHGWRWAATLAVAAGVAVVLVELWPHGDASRSTSQVPAPPKVLQVGGDVRVDGAAARAGDVLPSGAVVDVGDGRAAVRLCGGVDVHLDAATRLRLAEHEAAPCRVVLESGRIAVDAHGLPRGDRFVVSVSAGEVRVTGTVFAVEVVGRQAEVRVLEGSVVVAAGALPERALAAPQAMRIGADYARALTAAEAERDRRLAEWLAEGTVAASTTPPASVATPAVGVNTDRLAGEAAPVPSPTGAGTAASSAAMVAESPRPAASDPAQLPHNRQPGGGAAEAPASPFVPPTPAATALPPTAIELLDGARRSRAAGDWQGAASAYEALVTRWPDSPEARVALVPLGELRLERLGDAAGALQTFDKYLAGPSSGALGEEASWGRIRALRSLGRAPEEAEALHAFLAAHPASLRAQEARQRLAELEGGT